MKQLCNTKNPNHQDANFETGGIVAEHTMMPTLKLVES